MIYMMTKPCPICKQQLTKQKPTETVRASAVDMFGRDRKVREVRTVSRSEKAGG